MSNWVNARAECTARRMFEKLKEAVKTDFEAVNALPDTMRKLVWKPKADDQFGIVDESDPLSKKAVWFHLDSAGGVIRVREVHGQPPPFREFELVPDFVPTSFVG